MAKPQILPRKPNRGVDPTKAESFLQAAQGPKAPELIHSTEATPVVARPEPVTTPRPPSSRKRVLVRTNGEKVRQHTVYLSEELSKKLALRCAEEDLDKSSMLVLALEKYVNAP